MKSSNNQFRTSFRHLAASVLAVVAIAGLAACDSVKRVDKAECKPLTDHIAEVIVSEVKVAAGASCQVSLNEVRTHILEYIGNDCATYDANLPLKRKNFECMMKANSAAALDACYDAIPTTKVTTKIKKVAGVKFKKRERKSATTMAKPEFVDWIQDEKDAYCGGAAPAPTEGQAK